VTLLDANILVYVYNSDAQQHEAVFEWFEKQVAAGTSIALSWPAVWAFLRICTNPRAVARPLLLVQAFGIIRDLLALPGVALIQPGPRHLEILERLVSEHNIIGSGISDAVLAAIAIEHGAALASSDRDFRRFETLRWINPLAR
jgi:toxin-antitoxin system PIN domain toxin